MKPVKFKILTDHDDVEGKKVILTLPTAKKTIRRGRVFMEKRTSDKNPQRKLTIRRKAEAHAGVTRITSIVDLWKVLNGKAYTGTDLIMSAESPVQYITRIRKGVTGTRLRDMMKKTAITVAEMAGIMDLSQAEIKTISGSKKLDQNQSEKAVLIERLYLRGEQVFEGDEAFRTWMDSKVKSLGNYRPKYYLDTVSGINLVADEIERLAYGVFS
jgi:putative toxin-antitoxin system antitoxin component (TIGR02293 family)